MIDIAPETACVLYLAVGLVVVASIWLATRKKEVVHFSLQHHTCEFCSYQYIKDAQKNFSRCPQCNLMNTK
ncbi:MAG: hypothetical protein JSR37_03435 [Verrucomicrobia bacterium]|nr:hypothetical protein [Verrucomicrobiota bacterium]